MRDSTAKIESDQAMSELMTQYETDKKNKTIAFQNATIAQQKDAVTVRDSMFAGNYLIWSILFFSEKTEEKMSN
jgi:SepF-like predicted cell division protein (DUF552 family)